ncbi:ComEA family DNA-binding protein [Pseudothauera lacus]|nr:ComEA family DNA-binding protein [Pseudothauera lacus]
MKRFLSALLLSAALLPLAAGASTPIDINTADATTLAQINGIGPTKAQAIVDYRNQHGPFKSAAELARVPGIGERTVERIEPQVTVGAQRPTANRQ